MVDTKTADGGKIDADMVFGAGVAFMTVLSSASAATHAAVAECAREFGSSAVLDTITESGKPELLPAGFRLPKGIDYVAVHAPADARLAGDRSRSHIEAVERVRAQGFRVSLAGGIGPDTIDDVVRVKPEIVVVGNAITGNENPEGRGMIRKDWRNQEGWPGRECGLSTIDPAIVLLFA
jgi:3-hexulose-6-phosphate synthase